MEKIISGQCRCAGNTFSGFTNDDQVLAKLKSILFPHALAAEIKPRADKVEGLKKQILEKGSCQIATYEILPSKWIVE